jgi:hypothetical protein
MARRNNAVPRFSLFSFQDIVTCTTGIFLLLTLLLALELAEHMEASPQVQAPKVVSQLAVEQVQLDAQLAELEAEVQNQTELLRSGVLINAEALKSEFEHSQDRARQLDREQSQLNVLESRVTAQQQELEQSQQQREPEKEEIRKLQERLESAQRQVEKIQSTNRVFYNATVGSGRTPWLIEMSHNQIMAAKVGVKASPKGFPSTTEFLAWAGQQSASQIHLIILLKPDAVENYDKVIQVLREQMKFTVGLDVLKQDQHAIDPTDGASSI